MICLKSHHEHVSSIVCCPKSLTAAPNSKILTQMNRGGSRLNLILNASTDSETQANTCHIFLSQIDGMISSSLSTHNITYTKKKKMKLLSRLVFFFLFFFLPLACNASSAEPLRADNTPDRPRLDLSGNIHPFERGHNANMGGQGIRKTRILRRGRILFFWSIFLPSTL